MGNAEPQVTIRLLTPADAAAAAELSTELGYPVSVAIMQERLQVLAADPNHVVLGACIEGRLVAWIDVGLVQHLQSGIYGEIGGLIVAGEYRNRQIGAHLLTTAEGWIADRGIAKIMVRSQIARERAHSFYLRQGYTQTKVSAVFTKLVPVGASPAGSPKPDATPS